MRVLTRAARGLANRFFLAMSRDLFFADSGQSLAQRCD